MQNLKDNRFALTRKFNNYKHRLIERDSSKEQKCIWEENKKNEKIDNNHKSYRLTMSKIWNTHGTFKMNEDTQGLKKRMILIKIIYANVMIFKGSSCYPYLTKTANTK